MKKGSYITIRTLCLQRTRNNYQELDGRCNIPNEAPDAQEASEVWSNIWSIPGYFKENASWFPQVKETLSEIENQEDFSISAENVAGKLLCSGLLV